MSHDAECERFKRLVETTDRMLEGLKLPPLTLKITKVYNKTRYIWKWKGFDLEAFVFGKPVLGMLLVGGYVHNPYELAPYLLRLYRESPSAFEPYDPVYERALLDAVRELAE